MSCCSHSPLFSLSCYFPAPQEVLCSGVDALTIPFFKSGLIAHKHTVRLMRLFLPSLFCGPSRLLHLPSGEHSRQHLHLHSPKITLSVPVRGGVSLEQKQRGHHVLSSNHDVTTRTLTAVWAGAGVLQPEESHAALE